MRKTANLRHPTASATRLMVYGADDGAYLFGYLNMEDGPCDFDEFYATLEEAEHAAATRFGVGASHWQVIPDPLPGAQHDWICPVRGKRDDTGNRIYGQFEPIAQ